MNRTPLRQRSLPDYTRAEELFHMISHIVGGAMGVAVLVLCIVRSALHHSAWGVVASCIYGASMILLYTMSGIYHGLTHPTAKRVFQVLDHCTIYYLIAGTYTPVLFCAIRPQHPGWAWTLFGLVWGCAAAATVFTAIDLKKYAKLSMICYLAMGWCIVVAIKPALQAVPHAGLWWIFFGGVAYTVGAVLYGLGKKKRWMHAVFHIFVILGSLLQFIGIYGWML
ncbi:MAG: hemolysin III family protein [bacterium]|nr:hemolysin III family protein [bacterium]